MKISFAGFLAMTGCCLDVANGATTSGVGACRLAVRSPPDAGPLIVFDPNPNPSVADSGVTVTSAAGYPVAGDYTLKELAPDGGLILAGTFIVDTPPPNPKTSFTLRLPGAFSSLAGWSSDAEGRTLSLQQLTNADGRQVCTYLGEQCGSHGECCVGLSCQMTDGGCDCLYAWPTDP